MTAATTPLQQQTIADTVTGWTQPLDFTQFNPSLGTLTGVAFGLTGDVTGSIALANLDRAPATFGVAFDGALTLTAPDGSFLTNVAPVATATTTLAAGGGTTLADISGSASTQADYQPSTVPAGPAVAPFIGTGSVPLSVAGQSQLRVSGPGNMLLASQAAAGASVTLQYDYAPANGGGVGDTDDSSVTWLAASALGAFAVDYLGDTVTTPAQTFSFADRTTGWNDSLAVNQFDAALGTLVSINITLSDNILTHIGAENLGSDAASFNATDTATLTVDLPGSTPTITAAAGVTDNESLAAFDGSADYSGTSGYSANDMALSGSTVDTLSDPGNLAAFTGQNVVVLPISGTSAATIQGPGNLLAGLSTDAGGRASLSYTYLPAATTIPKPIGPTAAPDYTVFDTTTQQPGATVAQPAAVDTQTQQLIDHSSDNLAVTVTSDNWLIATGAGNDVITAHGGNNMIFAGGGSNLLVGGGGNDTFGVTGGGGYASSTVVNFHAGDLLVVWGLSPQTAALSWLNGQGAAGYAGLTLDATAPDGSATAVTLARYYNTADFANGRLSTGFGGDPASGSSFFYIHANS